MICPICKGKEFIPEKFGFPARGDGLRCQACGTVLSVSGGSANPIYRVEYLGKTYSNAAELVRDQTWGREDLESIDECPFSDQVLLEIAQGMVPPEFISGGGDCDVPFRTDANETVIFILENTYLWEERPNGERQSLGLFAFRIQPGGWNKIKPLGEPKAFNHIETLDNGTLYLTDRRYIFIGKNHKTDDELRRVRTVFPYTNGIGVMRSEKTRVEYIKGAYYWPLIGALLTGLAARSKKEYADREAS